MRPERVLLSRFPETSLHGRMRLFWKKEPRGDFTGAGSSKVTDKPVASQRKMHLKSLQNSSCGT